jgi:hypothetical protein
MNILGDNEILHSERSFKIRNSEKDFEELLLIDSPDRNGKPGARRART